MPSKSSAVVVISIAATVLFLIGVVIGVIDVTHAVQTPLVAGDGLRVPLVVEAITAGLEFIGLALVLYALAALLASQAASAEQAGQSGVRMLESLESVREAMEHAAGTISQAATHQTSANASPASTTDALTAAAKNLETQRQILAVLQEIRQLSLLNEQQKQAMLSMQRQRGKTDRMEKVADFLKDHHWARAADELDQLSLDFPDDPQVADLRKHLQLGREHDTAKMVSQTRERIEDAMAVSNWDDALAAAQELADDFPENEDARAMLKRVVHERDIFNESTAHRLYDEVKDDIERRHWRRALAGARKLIEKFPNHRRAANVRTQMPTIQANAEIEERQEQEGRIQALVRSKRFIEAIELAENLLDRFPGSPQADSLEQLLPKLRDLAVRDDAEPNATA